MAWWLKPRTSDPEVGGSSPTRVKPCCVLEQGTFTSKKVLVIPRKRWPRPNMPENLFTGALITNRPTKSVIPETYISTEPRHKKTCLRVLRPGPTQTGLCSHRKWLAAGNLKFRKRTKYSSYEAKT